MKTYTLDQIKKAFWEQFHESGELWFNYLGTDKENENSTQEEWDEFAKGLDKISPNQPNIPNEG